MDHGIQSRHDDLGEKKERQEGGPKTPPPPPAVSRFVKYLLAFGVSVAVGLAPLLGTWKVPLFSPLLNLIPDFLRQALIPLTSALMGLLAVLVHWFSEENLDRSARRKALMRSIAIAFVGAIALYTVTIFVVKGVDYGGPQTRQRGTFLIGFSRPYRDPCNVGVSDELCIKLLTFDQNQITSFWGDTNVNLAKLALSATYLTFMLGFASAVGIAVHQKGNLNVAENKSLVPLPFDPNDELLRTERKKPTFDPPRLLWRPIVAGYARAGLVFASLLLFQMSCPFCAHEIEWREKEPV